MTELKLSHMLCLNTDGSAVFVYTSQLLTQSSALCLCQPEFQRGCSVCVPSPGGTGLRSDSEPLSPLRLHRPRRFPLSLKTSVLGENYNSNKDLLWRKSQAAPACALLHIGLHGHQDSGGFKTTSLRIPQRFVGGCLAAPQPNSTQTFILLFSHPPHSHLPPWPL